MLAMDAGRTPRKSGCWLGKGAGEGGRGPDRSIERLGECDGGLPGAGVVDVGTEDEDGVVRLEQTGVRLGNGLRIDGLTCGDGSGELVDDGAGTSASQSS